MTTPNLTAIPSLDELLADSLKAAALPPEAARMLLAGLSGLLPVLIAAASRESIKADAAMMPDRLLTVEDAAKQFSVTPRWLYRHKRQLPHSQPTRKLLLFPEGKLRRWFQNRQGT